MFDIFAADIMFFMMSFILVRITVTAAVEFKNTTTPLDLLCFAMQNPLDRAKCGNKANSECLIDRIMRKKTENKYIGQLCNTDAVAKINIKLLIKTRMIACGMRSEFNLKNTVWVTVIVKNDAQTLVEWLIWHFLMGIDHALIYDNESTDNLKEALEPFEKAGIAERILFPGIGVQVDAYTDALARSKKGGAKWLAAIDADEYIVPIADRCIPEFLSRFLHKSFIAAIRLNWLYVNSMGKLWRWDNGILNQTILDRTGFHTGRTDHHIKTIAYVSRTLKFVDAHYAQHMKGTFAVSPDNETKGTYHFTNPPQTRLAVILHMHVRTLEEWILKRLRGRVSVKNNHCPHCNETLEVITSEWLCLNSEGYGILDKGGNNKRCRDHLQKNPILEQAPNFLKQNPLDFKVQMILLHFLTIFFDLNPILFIIYYCCLTYNTHYCCVNKLICYEFTYYDLK